MIDTRCRSALKHIVFALKESGAWRTSSLAPLPELVLLKDRGALGVPALALKLLRT